MVKKTVAVTQYVEVEVDEKKFDDKFINEFARQFYALENIDDHARHLAQLFARGLYDETSDFIEGYGPPKDMGIKVTITDIDTDLVEF